MCDGWCWCPVKHNQGKHYSVINSSHIYEIKHCCLGLQLTECMARSWRKAVKHSPEMGGRIYSISNKSGVRCQKRLPRAGTSYYIPQKLWNVIIRPCPWYLLLAQHSSLYMHAGLQCIVLMRLYESCLYFRVSLKYSLVVRVLIFFGVASLALWQSADYPAPLCDPEGYGQT